MGYQEGRKVKAIKSSLPSVPMPKVAQNRPDPGVALSDSFRASSGCGAVAFPGPSCLYGESLFRSPGPVFLSRKTR